MISFEILAEEAELRRLALLRSDHLRAMFEYCPHQQVSPLSPAVFTVEFILETEIEGHYPHKMHLRLQWYHHFQEETLSDRNDLALMRRLLPFAAPYRMLFVLSVLLVVMITLVDLSLPYITKITIDAYIVPPPDSAAKSPSADDASRTYRLNIGDERSDATVRKYKDRFTVEGKTAAILTVL